MTTETYIHEFRSLPHPGDFGIPKGHWWQAKAYAYHHADQLCAFTPQRKPLTRDQALKIVAANPDAMTAIRMTEAAHGIKE